MRILLVEDEPHIGSAVQEHVRAAGHAVDWVGKISAADDAMRCVPYSVITRSACLITTRARIGSEPPAVIATPLARRLPPTRDAEESGWRLATTRSRTANDRHTRASMRRSSC